MSRKNTDDIARRSVLKSIAAGTATVAAGTGVASADGAHAASGSVSERYVDQYADVDTVQAMVAERPDALDTLAEEGYIEQASVDALGFDQVSAGLPRDVAAATATVTELNTPDGTVVAVHVPVESTRGRARLTVLPEQERAVVDFPAEEGGDAFRDAGTTSIDCNGQECDCCQCRRYCDWLGCRTYCWCC